jgi:YafQ family addiction module toxin component
MLKPVISTQFKNHPLESNWKGFLGCHIELDLLLIYRVNEDKEELELARTDSHSELFE